MLNYKHMKSNIKIKVLLALILMSVGRVMWGATVTWDPSTLTDKDVPLTGNYEIVKDIIHISFSKDVTTTSLSKYNSSHKYLQFYSSNYITFACIDGYVITNVTFREIVNGTNCLHNYIPFFDPKLTISIKTTTSSDKKTKTETWNCDKICGPSNKIQFEAYGQLYVTGITVTYEQTTLNNKTLSISQAGYATYYNESPYFMPNGVDGYTITSAPQEGEITLYKACPSGSYVPENTALLIKGNPGTYPLYYHPDATPFTITNNWLHGDLNTTEHSGNGTYYKLSYDSNGKNLGFYRETEEGTSITNNAGKCYLLIPSTSSVKSISLSELEDNYILGVDYVTVKPQRQAYNIFGMPVKDDAKGIVIKNGKKYINR